MKLILTLLLVCASLTFAVDDEGAAVLQDSHRVSRIYTYNRADHDVTVRAENPDKSLLDKLEYAWHIEAGRGIDLKVKYESDAKTDATGRWKVEYRFMLKGLVEYTVPGGASDTFVKGTATIVRGYPDKTASYGTGSWDWDKFVEDVVASTPERKVYKVSTKDGVVTLTLKFNLAPQDISGMAIEQNDVKFDIEINGAKLAALGYGSTGSKFAILGVYQHNLKTSFCNDDDQAVCLNHKEDGRIAAFMRWTPTVQCSGVTYPIGQTTVEVDNTMKEAGFGDDAWVTFWSIRGDITAVPRVCVWDPQFATLEGSATTVFLSSVMILVAFLALFF